jgi:AraC-like DNA-binding protein
MDRISEAVAATRAGRAVAVRNRYAGAWSTRYPAVHGSGLHIVKHGSFWLVPPSGVPTLLHPGDAVFVPHGPEHGFSQVPVPFEELPPATAGERTPNLEPFDVEFVSCCYHLDRGQVHESFAGLPDVITLTIDDTAHPQVRILADLLGEHAATAGRPGHDVALPAIVDLLLVHLLRAWHDQSAGTCPTTPSAPSFQIWPPAADPQIAQILQLVRDNPDHPWSVQQLSGLARMSRPTFTRRFTETTGATPSDYLLQRRLDQGAELLRFTDRPLVSIARQLGYATEFSFAAAFRREFGIAPGRFRHRERSTQP